MRFEILGEISDIETFATGPSIRELPVCEGSMDVADGANAKALPGFDYPMAESTLLRYEAAGIGRKEFKIKHLL